MKSIKFSNSCVLPEWLPEHKKEFRKESNSYFEKALMTVPLFDDIDITVTYFQAGVGSIVAKIETSDQEEYVIKTSETINQINGEISSYLAMQDHGMSVPEIFFSGESNGIPFLVMEYFNEKTLQDLLNDKKISPEEVGVIKAESFCVSNEIKGEGFGWPIMYSNNKLSGNFDNLDSFLNNWFGNPEYIKHLNSVASDILWSDLYKENIQLVQELYSKNSSVLGSFDLQSAHFFTTNPPTFFDGSMRLEPKFFDIGSLLMPGIYNDETDEILKSLITVYKEKNSDIDLKKIKVAVWLQSYRKAANILKTPSEERKKRAKCIIDVISTKIALDKYISKYFV